MTPPPLADFAGDDEDADTGVVEVRYRDAQQKAVASIRELCRTFVADD